MRMPRALGLRVCMTFFTPLFAGACGNARGHAEEPMGAGQINLPLTAVSPSGNSYRLSHATFNYAGPSTNTLTPAPDQQTITQTLAAGSYSIQLVPGWFLERQGADSSFTRVDATLTSPNPVSFDIADQETTTVMFRFLMTGGSVTLGDGTLNLNIAVDEAPLEDNATACADQVDNDGDGLLDCADPSCETFCEASGTPALVITEILANPQAVLDSVGEWFEVANVGNGTARLAGCRLDSTNDPGHDLAVPVTIPTGGRFVFGNNADVTTNGGAAVGYQYTGIVLNNTSDTLSITCGGVLVDQITYTAPTSGASRELRESAIDANANDADANYCIATTTFGAGDLGSPGAVNASCP